MACCGGGAVNSFSSTPQITQYNLSEYLQVNAIVAKNDLKLLFSMLGHSNADTVVIEDKIYNPNEICFYATRMSSERNSGLFTGQLVFKKESSNEMIPFEQLFSLVQEE